MSGPASSAVFEFVTQLIEDRDDGNLRPLADYLARFPGHEIEIAREYLALVEGSGGSSTLDTMPDERSVGPFRVLRELGRGGQGVVYLAEEPESGRRVALKVLAARFGRVSRERRARLRREVEVVARLDHRGIAAIHAADLEADSPWIAMRLVEGETLHKRIAAAQRENHGSWTTEELGAALLVFEEAARALHAAHEAGIVHRDVKPGNVMVDADGHAVVLDFGLARLETSTADGLTLSGELLGTPDYMSPEQVAGRVLDRRTDVYSLGATLYEYLTLRRPFVAESRERLLRAIVDEPLTLPRALNRDLPRTLDVLLATALERDRDRRYATALDLAEELRRVREHERIHARPAGPLLRLGRWARRRPVLASASLGTLAVLATALGVTLAMLGSLRATRWRELSTNLLAQRPLEALELAARAATADPGQDSNRVLLQTLEGLWLERTLPVSAAPNARYDLDPDGIELSTADPAGELRTWHLVTGAERSLLRRPGIAANALAYAPVDRGRPGRARVAIGWEDGAAWIVDTRSGARVDLGGGDAAVSALGWSADGTLLVVGRADGTLQLADPATGRTRARGSHGGPVTDLLVLGRRGVLLAMSADEALAIGVFDTTSAARIRDLDGGADTLRAIAADEQEECIVATYREGRARAWRLDRPEAPTWILERTGGEFRRADFSPSGDLLALGHDLGLLLIDPSDGSLRAEPPNDGRRPVVEPLFHPTADLVAATCWDRTVRLFRASTGELVRKLPVGTPYPSRPRWARGGERLVVGRGTALDSTLYVLYTDQRPFLGVLEGHAGEVMTARFSRDGTRALTASSDGTARVWDVARRRTLHVLEAGGPLALAEFGGPGPGTGPRKGAERILTAGHGGALAIWSAEGRLEARYPGSDAALITATFTAGGSRAFVATRDGLARLVDFDSGELRTLGGQGGVLTCAAIDPEGERIALGDDDRTVRVYGDEPEPLFELKHVSGDSRFTQVYALGFDARGERLVACHENGRTLCIDPRTGVVLWDAGTGVRGTIGFTPDGRVLLGAKWGGDVLELDVRDGSVIAPLVPRAAHRNSIMALDLDRSGLRAATGGKDGGVRIWSLVEGHGDASYPGHSDAVWDVRFSTGGRWLLSASADGTARLWPSDLLETARTLLAR